MTRGGFGFKPDPRAQDVVARVSAAIESLDPKAASEWHYGRSWIYALNGDESDEDRRYYGGTLLGEGIPRSVVRYLVEAQPANVETLIDELRRLEEALRQSELRLENWRDHAKALRQLRADSKDVSERIDRMLDDDEEIPF